MILKIIFFIILFVICLFLYSCLVISKQADEDIEEMENFNERRKSD